MIKNIFLLLLVCISMSAQDLHIYCYSNYDSVILKLDSENRYTLSSLNPIWENCPDDLPYEDFEAPDVIWSEGNSVQKGDTLICTDIRLNKECWFLKEKNGDVMRVIKVQGFQYKNDVMNKQKILRQEKAVTAEIYDLLSPYPVFYITRHFVLNSKKERYITELFSWNDDIKKRIYYKKK